MGQGHRLFADADEYNLDARQTLIALFDAIRRHAQTQLAPAPSPMTRNAFYITTAIAYPNGEPHIGHAYEMIATDAIARWRRLEGRDVFFLTGTDEHGIKMVQTAPRRGRHAARTRRPQLRAFQRAGRQALNVSNDDFIRTTEQRHFKSSQEIWRRMAASNNGDIYQSTYKGWYSVRDEAYFDEDELTDGDDGKKLRALGRRGELGRGRRAISSASRPIRTGCSSSTRTHPDFIAPDERRNEIISFVKGGLQRPLDLAHDLRLGHPGAGRARPRHVCVGRCADQLHHRRRASPTTRASCSRNSGRRTCTSSARTSSASTRSTGRPS